MMYDIYAHNLIMLSDDACWRKAEIDRSSSRAEGLNMLGSSSEITFKPKERKKPRKV